MHNLEISFTEGEYNLYIGRREVESGKGKIVGRNDS